MSAIIDIVSRSMPANVSDVDYYYAPLNINISLTNVVIRSIDVNNDVDDTGIMPIDNQTAAVVVGRMNVTMTFDYDMRIVSHTTGNATVTLVDLRSNVTLHNSQIAVDGKHVGPVIVVCKHVDVDFVKIDANFSDAVTQAEWKLIFNHPKIIKMFVDDLLNFKLNEQFLKTDFKHLIKVNLTKHVKMTVGLSELVVFNETGKQHPDDRIMDMKLQASFIKFDILPIEGAFEADMQASPLSLDYSSITIDIDIVNKLLAVLTADNRLHLSFNQRLLDDRHITLIRLYTSSMKAIFPSLVLLGHDKGVFVECRVPSFDRHRFNVRSYSGHISIVMPLTITLFVSIDQSRYYNSTLQQCLTDNNCVMAIKMELHMHMTIAAQITVDKSIVIDYAGVDVKHIDIIPRHAVDIDRLTSMIDTVIDLIMPTDMTAIDISTIVKHADVSVDIMNDQRLIVGVMHAK